MEKEQDSCLEKFSGEAFEGERDIIWNQERIAIAKNEGMPPARFWNIYTVKQEFVELFAVLKASLVKGRWVALKRRLGGIPHAATPLFCKVFGEFVLPARIPPDRLKGDPTPFNKGVFGAVNCSSNSCLTG